MKLLLREANNTIGIAAVRLTGCRACRRCWARSAMPGGKRAPPWQLCRSHCIRRPNCQELFIEWCMVVSKKAVLQSYGNHSAAAHIYVV